MLLIAAEAELTDRVARRLGSEGHDVSLAAGNMPGDVRGYDVVCNLQPAEVPPRTWLGHQLGWRQRKRQRQALCVLAQALSEAPSVRLVQRSAARLYSDGGSRWIAETYPTEPSALTRHAHEAELMAAGHRRRGGTAVILRFAPLYAPDHPGTVEAVRLARLGWQAFHGPDDAYYPALHVAGAASAVAAAVMAPPGTYNVGNSHPATNRELNDALARIVGGSRLHPLWPDYQRSDLSVMRRSCRLDPAKFILATGWNWSTDAGFSESARQASLFLGVRRRVSIR